MRAPQRSRSLYRARLALFLLALAALAGPLALLPGRATAQAQPPALVVPVRLFAGWNDVFYEGVTLPVEQALGSVADAVPVVWEFDASRQRWNVWSASAPAVARSLSFLQTGGLYFLRSTRATFWLPPLTPPAAAAADPAPGSADAGADGDEAGSVPAQAGLWEVSFTRTTPLFALQDGLSFDDSGRGVVETLGAPARDVVLDADRLAGIARILEASDFLQQHPQDARSGCVSCFHYEVAVRAPDGDRVTILTDGVGLSGALLTMVDQLVAALIAALG